MVGWGQGVSELMPGAEKESVLKGALRVSRVSRTALASLSCNNCEWFGWDMRLCVSFCGLIVQCSVDARLLFVYLDSRSA